MSELEDKRRQLELAQRTLSELEAQAAGTPELERSAKFAANLREMRERVATLKEEVKRLQPPVSPPPMRIPFQNREDEIRNILSYRAPAYFLLDAPAGYGKSVLLEQLAERFKEEHWVVAHVCLDEHSNMYQLATSLARELGVKFRPSGSDISNWGTQLAGVIKRDRLAAITQSGLVFLIDLDEKPTPDIVVDFFDRFIPAVQKSLRLLRFFSEQYNRFRAILAGRHLASQIKSCTLPPSVLTLTPFDYDVVLGAVRETFSEYEEAVVIEVAAHLMHLTAGHPGCLAHCLKKYEEVGCTPDDFMLSCAGEVWTEVVRPVVQNVHDNVPQDLCQVLDRLSVFRRFDYGLLGQLLSQNIIAGCADEYQMADRLTGTYLLSWKGRWLRDDITRRLLAIRLREEEKENLQAWCRQAQEVCASRLQERGTQSPEVWAIEYLYQVLLGNAGVVQDPEQRRALSERFFANEVATALHLLTDGRHEREEIEALSRALEEDWEFRFTVNYFLRDAVYSDKPYQQLRAKAQAWLSPQPGKGAQSDSRESSLY